MSLGKVSIVIEAAMAQFESDLGRASRLLEKEAKRWQAQLKRYEDQAKVVGKALGLAIASGLALAATAIKQSINAMDDLSKSAQRVGLPTEELSKLNYAAGLADVQLETLSSTLGKLTKSQAAALKETSEQGRVFEALGIKVTDASGKLRKSSDVLLDFADRFAALKGSPEAMAAGFSIFGRNFQQLVPLIKDGSQAIREAGDEAERLGVVVSTDAGQRAEEFNDNLTRLKSAVQGFAMQIAADLLPDLIKLTENLLDLTKQGKGAAEIADVIRAGFSILSGAATVVSSTVRGVTLDLIALANAGAGAWNALTGDWKGAADRMRQAADARALAAQESADIGRVCFGETQKREVKVAIAGRDPEPPGMFRKSLEQVKAEAEAEKLQEQLRKALAGSGGKSGGRKAGKSDEEKEAEGLQRRYESLLSQQRERIALFGTEGEVAQVTYDITTGELVKLTQAQKDLLVENAKWIEFQSESADIEAVWANAAKESTDAAIAKTAAIDSVLDGLDDEIAMLGMSAEQQEIYNNLKWAGVDAESALGEEIAKTTKQAHEARKARASLDELADATRGLFEGVLDYTRGGKEAFSNFVDDIRMLAARLLADAALRQLGKFLSNLGRDGGGGSGGGGWGGFLTTVAAAFGGGRSLGGPTQRGRFYEVNENEPELYSSGGRTFLMAGARDGHVSPVGSGGGGEKGMTVLAVFGEDDFNKAVAKFNKGPQGERIAVTHFQRNQKQLGVS
ncbi:MAG TPA: hypothetical protein VIT90_15405 [Lysobacter sp.]